MSGFTTGAALLIAEGQLAPLLGVDSLASVTPASSPGAAIGLGSLLALAGETSLARLLAKAGMRKVVGRYRCQAGPGLLCWGWRQRRWFTWVGPGCCANRGVGAGRCPT